MEIPYSVALRLDIETFMLGYVLLTCAIFNDFSHKPSSSRFTHVNYKREISAFFASNILSHLFLLVQSVVYQSSIDCTFYVTCSCKFSFFKMAVFIVRSDSLVFFHVSK